MALLSLTPQALQCLKDLSNGFNGEMSAGLSGKGDSGLKESEKLALIPSRYCQTGFSRNDAPTNWDICVDDVSGSRVLVALAHAAHVARTLGLDGRVCTQGGGPELAKAIKVSAAYTVVWAGLTGYFQANPLYVKLEAKQKYTYKDAPAYVPAEDHISEFDTVDALFPLDPKLRVVAAYDDPAQSSKDMTNEEADICMKMAIEAIGQGKENWLSSYCTPDQATQVLTVILATKFNWYTTNHHVGQNHATKYICKVVQTTYRGAGNGPDSIHESIKDAVWKIGHWASTHLCLGVMEMRTGVRVAVHPAGSPPGKVVLSPDYRIRCDGAPAGLAKVALVYATIMLHRGNHMWLVAPDLRAIITCYDAYAKHLEEVKHCRDKKLVDPRCKDHEGGNYLTGGKTKTLIASTVAPLGVVGSFLFWKQPNSTLTASPLISTPSALKVKVARYTNYPDFNAIFDDACKTARDTKMKMTSAVGDFIGKSNAGVSCSLRDYVEFMGSFDVSRAEAEKKYLEAAEVFEVDLTVMEGEVTVDPQPGTSSGPPPVVGTKKRKHAEVSEESDSSDTEMPAAP